MRPASLLVIASALSLCPMLSIAEDAGVDAYVGRWNLRIDASGDTFSSSWIRIEEAGDGYTGSCVWKWGSVEPIRDIALEGGELRFRRGDESFKAKRMGEELRGEATMKDGKKFAFAGRKADEMCDVAGTWKIRRSGDTSGKTATLVLEEKSGKIGGSATDPDGVTSALAPPGCGRVTPRSARARAPSGRSSSAGSAVPNGTSAGLATISSTRMIRSPVVIAPGSGSADVGSSLVTVARFCGART